MRGFRRQTFLSFPHHFIYLCFKDQRQEYVLPYLYTISTLNLDYNMTPAEYGNGIRLDTLLQSLLTVWTLSFRLSNVFF